MARVRSVEYPITELFAWVVDDPTGAHGILGLAGPGGMPMQCVSSRRDLMEGVRGFAEAAARMTGLPVQLRRYVLATVEEVAKP